MIVKQSAELVIDFLDGMVPDELLKNDAAIIAGGSALSLFMANRILAGLSPGERSIMKIHLQLTPVMKFSDIDIWLLKGSDQPHAELFDSANINLSLERKEEDEWIRNSNYSSVYALSRQKKIKLKSGTMTPSKSSPWAITYQYCPDNLSKKVLPIQCIVKQQDSVESLLDGFDLGICSVAIHRGEFYIHHSLPETLEQGEIIWNSGKDFGKKSFGTRLFQTLRFFKYVDKTGFDFSKDLYRDVLTLMADASLVYAEAKKGGFKDNGQVTISPAGSNYDQHVTTKKSIIGMISQLAPQFQSKMMKMKHHQDHDALFLTDSEVFPLAKIIDFDKHDRLKEAAKANTENGITNPCREIDIGELLADI